jgi:hypothetical protein
VLTDHQKAFFETFGYLCFPGMMKDNIAEITTAFTDVFTTCDHHHDGTERSGLGGFIDRHARLRELLDDPRIHGIASDILGDDFNYVGSDGNYYVGDTRWHCDSMHEHNSFIKIVMYLDPVRADTGALRVIPGSHIVNDARAELGVRVRDSEEAFGIYGSEMPAVSLDSDPGDVVVFHHTTLHASYGGSDGRRMFTLNMSSRYDPAHLEDLAKYVGVLGAKSESTFYHPDLMATASPQCRRHLEQVLALEAGVRG